MKFSELREGNIVDQNGVIAPVNTYQIYQFSLFQMGIMDKGDQYDFYAGWKPVELTTDRISGMGFVNDGTWAYFLGEFGHAAYYVELEEEEEEDDNEDVSEAWSFKIVVAGTITFFQSKTLKKVEYAHELQNLAFDLTGKELDTTKISEL